MRERVAASDGAALDLTVWRAAQELTLTLVPRSTDLPLPDGGFETRYLIGLTSGAVFDYGTRQPGALETVTLAGGQLWTIIRTSVEGLYYMIVGQISTCNLSSPIGIAEASVAKAADGAVDFIWFLGVISVAIGFLNLFPIPPLDGGHLMFHAYEAVARRPANDQAVRLLMSLGMALVFTLFLFALFNDLTC